MLYTDASAKFSFFGYGLPSVLVTEANIYSLSTWYNYVLTYDGATLKIYRDNVLVGSQASVGTITPSATDFKFGFYNNAEFNGKMKKARIYNRVLNAGEIAALYEDGYTAPTSVNWNNG